MISIKDLYNLLRKKYEIMHKIRVTEAALQTVIQVEEGREVIVTVDVIGDKVLITMMTKNKSISITPREAKAICDWLKSKGLDEVEGE